MFVQLTVLVLTFVLFKEIGKMMNKQQLVDSFGGKAKVARFLGVSRARVTNLPEKLSHRYQDAILGRMYRNGMKIPDSWKTYN